nr:M56 family metallopeptidase [uncultured Ruminococcus sp.]
MGLYAVTFVRMALPFEFGFTNTISDHSFYPVVIDALTPDKKIFFVPEFTWLNLLVSVWIVGSVIYILRVMIKYYKAVEALKANVIDCTPEMQAKLDLVSQKCGIRRKVGLKITDCVISPVTYGFFKPVILFPNREFDDRNFDYIAMHECCHIKNKDIWIKLLTEIYCGIFWWNPFAHLLKKDLSYCLELRCDRRVTRKLSDNRCTVYYEVLVTQMKAYKEQKESEKSDRETALKSALVGMSFVTNDKGEKIVSRMEMILYPKKKQTIINNVVTALMALLIVGIFFGSYCFLIVPGWDATYEDCVADLIESGEYNDNVEVYDETNMYVYVEKDKTSHLIFKPYDEKKGIVYTDDNSIIIPYEQVENGEYSYCLVLREK